MPDPPSNVMAHPVERREKMIKVTWNLPITWKEKDDFYDLTYEVRYRPSNSSNEQVCLTSSYFSHGLKTDEPGMFPLIDFLFYGLYVFLQENTIRKRTYLITDALPGVEYLIHLRVREEYDGLWSEWTSPVSARSWTGRKKYTQEK